MDSVIDLSTATAAAGAAIRSVLETHPGKVALSCSFGGPSGMVLLDLALREEPQLPVFFIDTGLLFRESYELVVRVEARYDPSIVAGLRARGHSVEFLGAYDHAAGHAHAIAIDHERGTLAGASDPRADSRALGA